MQMAKGAGYCYEDFKEIDPGSAKKHLRPAILEPLRAVTGKLAELPDWCNQQITDAIQSTADSFEIKMGKLGQPIRVAVTGGSVSPPLDVTLKLIGRERSLSRLDHAIRLVEERAAANLE